MGLRSSAIDIFVSSGNFNEISKNLTISHNIIQQQVDKGNLHQLIEK